MSERSGIITLENGNTVLVKRAPIAAATSGANTLLAAVTGKKIRILSLAMIGAGAVNAYFTSAAAGAVIFGGSTNKITVAAAGDGFVLPHNPDGWFETVAGELLNLNLSGAVAVSGGFTYCEV